jgi:hypothetical protein
MLREAFGEHSLSWTVVFEWHSRFKANWLSLEDDEHLGRPSTSKTTENVEKIRKQSPNNQWACRHRLDQLWRLPGDVNRKFEHALHCRKVCSLILDKWSKAAVCKHVSWAMREG